MDNAIRVIILIISLFLFGEQLWKFLFVVYGKTMQQEDPQGLIEAAKHLPQALQEDRAVIRCSGTPTDD